MCAGVDTCQAPGTGSAHLLGVPPQLSGHGGSKRRQLDAVSLHATSGSNRSVLVWHLTGNGPTHSPPPTHHERPHALLPNSLPHGTQ